MHRLVADTQAIVARLKQMHATVYTHMLHSREAIKDAGAMTQGDRADLIYLFRETGEIMDDLGKEARALRSLLDRILCAMWVKESSLDMSDPSVRGEIAMAIPSLRMSPRIPKRRENQEAYDALMRRLGFSDEVIELEAARPHYPGLVALCTKLAERGESLPGVLGEEPVYSTTVKALNGTTPIPPLIEFVYTPRGRVFHVPTCTHVKAVMPNRLTRVTSTQFASRIDGRAPCACTRQ